MRLHTTIDPCEYGLSEQNEEDAPSFFKARVLSLSMAVPVITIDV